MNNPKLNKKRLLLFTLLYATKVWTFSSLSSCAFSNADNTPIETKIEKKDTTNKLNQKNNEINDFKNQLNQKNIEINDFENELDQKNIEINNFINKLNQKKR